MARDTDIRGLLKKVRRIHIRSKKAVEEFMAGQYRSVVKGEGIEFLDVRDYRIGDEVRSIDWNVTARTGKLHVKTFAEERETNVLLLVDGSASASFGSLDRRKADHAAELCALLAFAAAINNDRVGLVLFAGEVERHVPPRKGVRHGLRIVREILAFEPASRGTNLACALQHLMRTRRRRSVVFLVSDFLDEGFEEHLGPAAARHDLVAVRISDPRERELAGKGIVALHDLETGERADVDLGPGNLAELYAGKAGARAEKLRRTMAAHGVDLLEAETGQALSRVLRTFFQKRMRQRRLG